MNKSLTLPISPSVNSIESYIRSVQQIPLLSAEEETALALRLRQNNDLDAARQLVLSHLRFVIRVARGYTGYGLALPDLIQEGNIGLMKAVKRFDPSIGVRLVSFAVYWVRAEIHEFILRNWRIVKIATTKAQRKLFFNLRSHKKRLGWLNQEEVNAVAAELNVNPATVLEMEARLSGQDFPYESRDDRDEADPTLPQAPANYLQDTRMEPASQLERTDWEEHHQQRLQSAIAKLDARSQDILEQRWLREDKTTLQELAERHQVSAERIRQLEKSALAKLKGQLEA